MPDKDVRVSWGWLRVITYQGFHISTLVSTDHSFIEATKDLAAALVVSVNKAKLRLYLSQSSAPSQSQLFTLSSYFVIPEAARRHLGYSWVLCFVLHGFIIHIGPSNNFIFPGAHYLSVLAKSAPEWAGVTSIFNHSLFSSRIGCQLAVLQFQD